MSAFITSDTHIATLAYNYLIMVKEESPDDLYQDLNRIRPLARLLLTENTKSVNYRYNKQHGYKLPKTFKIKKVTIVELYKLIQCWKYQTCEHPNHEKSKAWKMIVELELTILDTVMTGMYPFAKEYENAAWDIE